MKKVLTSFVIVSALVLAVSCGNNNGKKQTVKACTEQVESKSCADSCCTKSANSEESCSKGSCSEGSCDKGSCDKGSCDKGSCCSKTK